MSSASTKIIQAAAGNAGEALYVEDVFSTYLYTGTGSAQTITNDIDLDGEGGLVWIKDRGASVSHFLCDTERGRAVTLKSDTTQANGAVGASYGITSFNNNGFSLGLDWGSATNGNTDSHVSWTFRKAPKFFDVVTYTGTGSATTVSHNLGSVPGCIMVKRTDTTGDWQVYHRANTANPETDYLVLNSNAATADSNTRWNDTAPTASVFTVGTEATVNASGGTYVAYLFAHNNGDGDFGESGDQDIIKCGSYTIPGAPLNVSLGWEPQWLLIKRADSTASWYIMDTMRGFTVSANPATLKPNSADAEGGLAKYRITNDGFGGAFDGGDSGTYIYIAIRRSPMKTPESGTEVFAIDTKGTGTMPPQYHSGFPVDFAFYKLTTGSGGFTGSRLTQGEYLVLNETSAAVSASNRKFDYQDGWFDASQGLDATYSWMFRRAPGFFDVVAYEGTGSPSNVYRDVTHNLGVQPEMMWLKRRDSTSEWTVNHKSYGAGWLNLTNSWDDYPVNGLNHNDAFTATTFSAEAQSEANFNVSGADYIAYLFATLPGVSKVGSYTGNGTSQTIDCGFSAGARFVITKRVNSTGNWNVWDSERGIVAGNDPRLELNTTDAEDTGHDYIDPDNSGFVVNYVADDDDDSNVSGDEYIFLAIA